MDKQDKRLVYLALVRQPVLEKDNCEFKRSLSGLKKLTFFRIMSLAVELDQ